MTKDANAKNWTLTLVYGRYYSDPGNEPSTSPTLWVDAATGDDSRSKATVAASGGSLPWATIGRAAWGSTNRASPNTSEAAAAGDIVAVAAGTYSYAGAVNDRFSPVYNCANEGTVSNPIVFRAVGNVRLAAVAANSPVIGSSGKDYIRWTAADRATGRWLIDCDPREAGGDPKTGDVVNTTSDTGPVILHDCVGTWIECSDVDGGFPIDYTDNWNAFRVENCSDFVIRNNTAANFTHASGGNHNQSCLTLYGAAGGLVEHNEFSDSNSGIFFKDTGSTNPQNNNIVRFNRLHDLGEAFAFSVTTEDRNYIYQNLVYDCAVALGVTGGGLCNDWVFNNTVYNCGTSCVSLANGNGSGGRVWNNIFHTAPLGIFTQVSLPAATVVSFEHNCYYSMTTFFDSDADGSMSFGTFNSTYTDQHAASPASITTDPLFTNLAGGDYTLQAGSPARNLAGDPGGFSSLVHAGAYQTGTEVIGVQV